jgi:hypothetical protein
MSVERLRTEARWAPLRGHPRYQLLVNRSRAG